MLPQKYIICEKIPPSDKAPRLPRKQNGFSDFFFQDMSPIHKK